MQGVKKRLKEVSLMPNMSITDAQGTYARFRGLTRVMQQCFMAATAQNMKKIALHLWKVMFILFFSLQNA